MRKVNKLYQRKMELLEWHSLSSINIPAVKSYPLKLSASQEPKEPQENAISRDRPTRKTAVEAAQTRRRPIGTGSL